MPLFVGVRFSDHRTHLKHAVRPKERAQNQALRFGAPVEARRQIAELFLLNRGIGHERTVRRPRHGDDGERQVEPGDVRAHYAEKRQQQNEPSHFGGLRLIVVVDGEQLVFVVVVVGRIVVGEFVL